MFFKKKDKDQTNDLIKVTALLIHAAKIDQNFSKKEEDIIKQALIKMGVNASDLDKIMIKSLQVEENSNQILEFTKEVKSMNEEKKIQIIEILWKIIYSNEEADIYETSLMRKLAGLLYIDNKTMGNIKEKIQKEIS